MDLPPVIELKQALYPPQEGPRYLAASVTDPRWLDALPFTPPVLVIAEGLLMYLKEEEVTAPLTRLREAAEEALLIFDAYSPATLRRIRRMRALRRTGATVHWAMESPAALEAQCPGLRHAQTLWLTDAPGVARLDPGSRFLFGVASRFSAARQAHRIEIMELAQAGIPKE